MCPTITVFGKEIAMYGLCILMGLIIGIFLATLRSKKTEVEKEDVLYASLLGSVGIAAGGKILYLITIAKPLWEKRIFLFENKEFLFHLLQGGFVFYGGLIGAFVVIFIYCRAYNINIEKMFLAILPSVPLIHAFGRVGCFCAGCCYGIPYGGPMHIIFERSPVAPLGVALFPVQLVESGVNMIIYIILEIIVDKTKSIRIALSTYLITYGIMRFFLEFLRGDKARGILFELSTSQWISLVMVLGAFIALCIKKKPSISKEDVFK